MKVYFSSVICFFLLAIFPNFLIAQALPRVEQMTLEQKVGQLFIIGFPQQRVDSQLEDFIKKYKISSFILFKRNIRSLSQVAKMNSDLKTIATATTKSFPIIAVDQEGGQVARVPTRPQIPNAMSIGQTQDASLAYSLGQETAKIIRTLGFNMNLAPVLDICNPHVESFIGQRSFGSDADQVSSVGVALSKGLLDEAVIPTAKHFPGVGSVSGDPHKISVEYDATAETLYAQDLKPFSEFSKLGTNTAIMLSHLSYPALDPTNTPATLSAEIIKSILRKRVGFNGLIVTDDIQMKGLINFKTPYDAALAALKAGADIVMMTWSFKDQAKAIEKVRSAVASGELSEEELTEKVSRILLVKQYLEKVNSPLEKFPNSNVVALSTKRLREIESKILDFNVNVALKNFSHDDATRTPASISERTTPVSVCVFSPKSSFIESYKKSDAGASGIKIRPKSKASLIAQSFSRYECQYGVYVVYGPSSAGVLSKLSKEVSEKLLLVNLSLPNLVDSNKKYLGVVNLFFAHPDAGKKIADHFPLFLKNETSRELAEDKVEPL